MQCHEVEARLDELLDGRFSLTIDEGVNAHLAGCNVCRQLASELEQLMLAVDGASIPMVEPSSNFAQVVLAESSQGEKAVQGHRSWLPYLAVAATVAFAFAGWWIAQSGQDPDAPHHVIVAASQPWWEESAPKEGIQVVFTRTGREIAFIPNHVLRAGSASATSAEYFAQQVRPVGVAWEAFRRTLPIKGGHATTPTSDIVPQTIYPNSTVHALVKFC